MEDKIEYFNKDIYTAIGLVSVNFELLSFIIKAISAKLISDDPKLGSIVTTNLSYQNLCDVFIQLMLYRFGDKDYQRKDIEKIAHQLSEVGAKRNEIIHSNYFIGENDKIEGTFKVKARGKKPIESKVSQVTLDKIQKVNREITDQFHQLNDWYIAMYPGEKLKYG